MTRTFSKTTTDSPLKLTALCLAIALGWIVHGEPTFADGAEYATAELLHFAGLC